jgi:hypothetical protein
MLLHALQLANRNPQLAAAVQEGNHSQGPDEGHLGQDVAQGEYPCFVLMIRRELVSSFSRFALLMLMTSGLVSLFVWSLVSLFVWSLWCR